MTVIDTALDQTEDPAKLSPDQARRVEALTAARAVLSSRPLFGQGGLTGHVEDVIKVAEWILGNPAWTVHVTEAVFNEEAAIATLRGYAGTYDGPAPVEDAPEPDRISVNRDDLVALIRAAWALPRTPDVDAALVRLDDVPELEGVPGRQPSRATVDTADLVAVIAGVRAEGSVDSPLIRQGLEAAGALAVEIEGTGDDVPLAELAERLEALDVKVGAPYRDRLADAIVVDQGDLALSLTRLRPPHGEVEAAAWDRLSAAVRS